MLTDEDALGVARLIAKADGGCPYCVSILIGQARAVFPGYNWRELVRQVDPRVLEFPDEEQILQSFRQRVGSKLEHLSRSAD